MGDVVALAEMLESELGRVEMGEETALVEHVEEGVLGLHHGCEGKEDVAEEARRLEDAGGIRQGDSDEVEVEVLGELMEEGRKNV